MPRISRYLLAALAVTGLVFAPQAGAAQEPVTPAGPTAVPGQPTRPREIQLVFEREVFTYSATSRRDPFRSLANMEGVGPLFDDLHLRMIIHSNQPGQSVALVVDGSKKVYRLRKGDVVGNATVLDITEDKVTFTVEDFGNRRQEVLDLKSQNQKQGA